MKRLERVLLAAALLLAIGSGVVWAANHSLALESLGGLVVAVLLCGFALALELTRLDRRLAAAELDAPNWAKITKRVGYGVGSIQESTRRSVVRDVGALLTLHELVKVRGETPPHAPWVALPETVLALVGYVTDLPKGSTILEIGSGLSTVWLALAAEQRDAGIRIVSLEHDVGYAESTRAALTRQRLSGSIEVRLAPLEDVTLGAEKYSWYAHSSYEELSDIRLVFVDGPPGATREDARYPALDLLAPHLADGAVVVLDDTNRADEKDILARWLRDARPDGTVTIERELDHATVLRFHRSETRAAGKARA